MKKFLLSILLISSFSYTEAQWLTNPSNDAYNNNSSGRVGIGTGTSSLSAQFHVKSSSATTGNNTAQFDAPNIGSFPSHIHWGTTGDWYIRSASNAGKVIIQDTGGNVGIGTDAPVQKLHIKNGALMASDQFDNINVRVDGSLIPSIKFTRWIGSGSIQHNAFIGQFSNSALGGEYSFGIGTGYSANGDQNFNTTLLTATLGGSIGIGTTTPQSKFDIQSNVNNSALRIQGGLPYGTYYMDVTPILQSTPWSVGYSFNLKSSNGSYNNVMTLIDGNVGIGTSSPAQKLHIKNGALLASDQSFDNINVRVDGSFIPSIKFTRWIGSGSIQHNAFIGQFSNSALGGEYSFGIGTGYSANGDQNFNTTLLTATLGGNIGIGTSSPDSKLTVKGDIHTREVRVDMAGSVAGDYVFEDDYNLTSLTELESYLKKNKHLPEVPSAKEFEEQGMKLKEMNLMLLKKVEELTLYVIAQQKEIEILKNK